MPSTQLRWRDHWSDSIRPDDGCVECVHDFPPFPLKDRSYPLTVKITLAIRSANVYHEAEWPSGSLNSEQDPISKALALSATEGDFQTLDLVGDGIASLRGDSAVKRSVQTHDPLID